MTNLPNRMVGRVTPSQVAFGIRHVRRNGEGSTPMIRRARICACASSRPQWLRPDQRTAIKAMQKSNAATQRAGQMTAATKCC